MTVTEDQLRERVIADGVNWWDFVRGEEYAEWAAENLTAAYVETQHPRHPAGTERGGEWRAKGPSVNETHVASDIEGWVQETIPYITGTPEEIAKEIADGRAFLWQQYHDYFDDGLELMRDRLAGFTDVTIQPDVADSKMTIFGFNEGEDVDRSEFRATFNVALPENATGSKPDATVWVSEKFGVEVEDVLDVTDPDFFDSTGDGARYANMLDAIRGIKRSGTVTLYRGMSAAEKMAWDDGADIPMGKFFTSRPTTEYAADISGEFPELHAFEVAAEDVAETDPGIFQTIRDTRRRPDGVLRASANGNLTAAFDESKHPRYPKGHPLGGKFAPKGFLDAARAAQLGSDRDPEWTGPKLGPKLAYHVTGQGPFDAVERSDVAWAGEPLPLSSADTTGVTDILDTWGMTAEEYRQQANMLLKNELRHGVVVINTPTEVVDQILMDGRFRTQFETGRSEGALVPDLRKLHEEMYFGYPPDLPEEQRPVYGYVDFGEAHFQAEQYGNVSWTLRHGVKSRTTVATVDSLSRPVVPGPWSDPGGRAMTPPRFTDIGGVIHNDWLREGFMVQDEYVEAQVHGGVSLDDVEAVDIEKVGGLTTGWEDRYAVWGEALKRRRIRLQVWPYGKGVDRPIYTND